MVDPVHSTSLRNDTILDPTYIESEHPIALFEDNRLHTRIKCDLVDVPEVQHSRHDFLGPGKSHLLRLVTA